MSIAARGEFPVALSAVFDWLQPVGRPHHIVRQLHAIWLGEAVPFGCIAFVERDPREPTLGATGIGTMLDSYRGG